MTIKFPEVCPQCQSTGGAVYDRVRDTIVSSPCVSLGTQATGLTHFRCMRCGHTFLIEDTQS